MLPDTGRVHPSLFLLSSWEGGLGLDPGFQGSAEQTKPYPPFSSRLVVEGEVWEGPQSNRPSCTYLHYRVVSRSIISKIVDRVPPTGRRASRHVYARIAAKFAWSEAHRRIHQQRSESFEVAFLNDFNYSAQRGGVQELGRYLKLQ